MGMKCKECGGTEFDYDHIRGEYICQIDGFVVDDNIALNVSISPKTDAVSAKVNGVSDTRSPLEDAKIWCIP